MSETSQFKLPLVAAAQAQKHVTVNEALARLDAVAQLQLVSVSATVPPLGASDGTAYGVPAGAVNDWNGHAGEVAVLANGGWVFLTPLAGWRAFVIDDHKTAFHDGTAWRTDALVVSAGGAATIHRITEIDHVIGAGATSTTANVIANGEQVIGITGRVVVDLTGTGLTGWELGVAGSSNRYGSGLGISKNSWVRGLSGAPVTYWADTPLVLTPTGGNFATGTVRLAVHSVALEVPASV